MSVFLPFCMSKIKRYLVLFQSVKFNIGLFAVLAFSSLLGTVIPQFPENPEGVRDWMVHSPKISPYLQKIYFFDVYHSWWFVSLLGLMAFDVIVCKLIFGKFPGWQTFRSTERSAEFVRALAFNKEWDCAENVSAVAAQVTKRLKKEKYRSEIVFKKDGSVLILAARQRLQRYGSWTSHIAIVLVLLSNLTGALYGFRETMNVPEGSAARMQHRPWTVACDKFSVEWYKDSKTPKTFSSQIRLFDAGFLKAEKKVLVNYPLQYRGTRFYQSTYGAHLKEAKIGVFLRDHPKQSPTLFLHLDEEVKIPNTPYSLRILQFIPDFVMDEKLGPSSRSALPQNPALQILISKNGQPLRAPWIFQNFPGMHMPPITEADEFILILADYQHAFYTGLQITYDPGANLFWTACAILVVSLMLLFYLHCRRVWVYISPMESWTKIIAGGLSSRGKHFEQEWMRVLQKLQ